jgi:hypothetical protein
MADNAGRNIAAVSHLGPPSIARPSESSVELGPDHRLDELPHPITQPSLDWIEPVVEQINRRLSLTLNRIGLRGSARHGVVCCPARQRRTRSG